jgi:hypothetical protein
MIRAVVVLPEPVSPTIASDPECGTVKLTFFTAFSNVDLLRQLDLR